MKKVRVLIGSLLTFLVVGVLSVTVQWTRKDGRLVANREAQLQAGGSLPLHQLIDRNCGMCHDNLHFRPPNEYSLQNGATAHTAGIFGRSIGLTDPTTLTNGDPETALLYQKPAGAISHGGPKFQATDPVIVALKDWLSRGAPTAEMDPPAVTPPQYKNVSLPQHQIVYSHRLQRPEGFNSNRNSTPGGDIYRMTFHYDSGVNKNVIDENINLTNLPNEDAMNPTVSLDGTMVAYARKVSGQPWQIYEVSSNGGSSRQITHGAGNKIQPQYLPWTPDGVAARAGEGGIVYLSDETGQLDEYDQGQTESLFVCDTNGSNAREIDFNPSHQLNPYIHSSGVMIFTRWEHNEHQEHNFMPLMQISGADYLSAGAGIFGAYGEHFTSDAGNALHESWEVLPTPENAAYKDDMIARGSRRSDVSGSIEGPFYPRLQGTVGTAPHTNTIAKGDNFDDDKPEDSIVDLSSITYREARSLMGGQYIVSVATLTSYNLVYDDFKMATDYALVFSNYQLHTFTLTGTPPTMQGLTEFQGLDLTYNNTEAVPLLVLSQPGDKGKPVDLSKSTGFITSGDVTLRQTDDGQSTPTHSQVKFIRILRAIQLAQGHINTGQKRGIATVEQCLIPVNPIDGSFSAEVPANVPFQLQSLDANGIVLVSHKPWYQVAPGETARCEGCHAPHDKVASLLPMRARQSDPFFCDVSKEADGINYMRDIQPIFTQYCVQCHKSTIEHGGAAAGLALDGEPSFNGVPHSYSELKAKKGKTGIPMLIAQKPGESWLIQVLTASDTFTGASVITNPPHFSMLAANHPELIALLIKWVGLGLNARVSVDGYVDNIQGLDPTYYQTKVRPTMMAECKACHFVTGGAGTAVFDASAADAENAAEQQEEELDAIGIEVNPSVPDGSPLLRKVTAGSGLTHTGPTIFTKGSPAYMVWYNWIAKTNAAGPQTPLPTDLVHVQNYPNPFRDQTYIVYGLQGALATKVDISVYSQTGKVLKEFSGTTAPGPDAMTIGYNTVVWDGTDKDGHTVGNDVYFYVIKVEFADGTKKKFRGKCVKIR